MIFKVGDKVKIIKDQSFWGDTEYGLKNGTINQSVQHEVLYVRPHEKGQGIALNSLDPRRLVFWVGSDCLCLVGKGKSKKPGWL